MKNESDAEDVAQEAFLKALRSSEILKADSLIARAVGANDRRIRDIAQLSDARIRERLRNTADEH